MIYAVLGKTTFIKGAIALIFIIFIDAVYCFDSYSLLCIERVVYELKSEFHGPIVNNMHI